MIDFANGSVFKLSPADPGQFVPEVAPLLVQGEQVFFAFKGVRDFVVFTDKRLIAVNVQGMTGKKRDFTSLPYSKIHNIAIAYHGKLDFISSFNVVGCYKKLVRCKLGGAIQINGCTGFVG